MRARPTNGMDSAFDASPKKVPDGFLAIQDASGVKHAIDVRNRAEDAPSLWDTVPVCGMDINATPPDIFTETDCVRCESIISEAS